MDQSEAQLKKKSAFRDFLEALLIALAIALPVKYFIASPFIVVGSSMFPTFKDREYLIIDKLVYKLAEPKRLDVVVFRPPVSDESYFIKRIVGLPGERVQVDGSSVTVTDASGRTFTLVEPYVSSMRDGVTDVTLKADEYFVMGDNRNVSSDSRVWGPLPKSRISGRVDLRLFPVSTIYLMPGKPSSE